MKEKEENSLPQDKDRHLDIPSESNREKHINFLDVEDTDDDQNTGGNRKDKETEERQKQWREGVEEGKKMRNNE